MTLASLLSSNLFAKRTNLLLLPVALTLTGCTLATTAGPGKPDPVVFTGSVIGGENPIKYATVTFYETANNGTASNGVYSGTASVIESTVTDANGNFSFASATPCNSSSDYVYATASGGNTGTNAINPNELIMSAVGSCSSFGSSTFVIINELSTIAAAYALQGFTTVSGTYTTGTAATITDYSITSNVATINTTAAPGLTTGQTVILSGFTTSTFLNGTYIVQSVTGSSFTVAITNANVSDTTESGTATPITIPVVNVTASSTNYATASATTPSAAGLAHAFTNASNLKTPSSAKANTSVPGATGTIVPAATINALANSIQSCVNSTGGTASSSATQGCAALFYYTTVNSVAPTNTLSALLNIARNPTSNVYKICSLTPSQPAFSPAVNCGTSGSPAFHDWSMAIVYPQLYGQTSGSACSNSSSTLSGSSTNGLCYPLDAALDINDNVYVLNSTANVSSVIASNVVAISAAGSPIWASSMNTTFTLPEMIAVDGIGNVFYTNQSGTSADEYISQFTTANGTAETNIGPYSYLFGIAIDSSNKVWATKNVNPGSQNVDYFTRDSGDSGYAVGSYTTLPKAVAGGANQIAIDASGNLWISENNGSSSSPTIYASGHNASEFAASSTTTYSGNYGIAVDSHGYGWATSASGFYKMVPSPAGSSPTSATVTNPCTYTPSGGTADLRFLSVDGNNTIWGADDNGSNSAIVACTSAASTPAVFYLQPCIAATGTACASGGTGTNATHHAVPDSTGSLWVTSDVNGTLAQIVGAAAPSWPLLSLLKFGMP